MNRISSIWKSLATDGLRSHIERELEAFMSLDENWSVMKEGGPISQEVVERTSKLYHILRNMSFELFEVQPGLSGEVLLGAQRENKGVEIIVNQDSTYEYYLEENDIELEAKVDLDYSSLLPEIIKLSEWTSSEYLTQGTTAQQNYGTHGWRLGLRQKMEESQYSRKSAPYRIVEKSVSTSRNTIAA